MIVNHSMAAGPRMIVNHSMAAGLRMVGNHSFAAGLRMVGNHSPMAELGMIGQRLGGGRAHAGARAVPLSRKPRGCPCMWRHHDITI